jgi:type II secretory pathway pseudopilin PulG
MTRRGSRGRAGITLTEILISIMIMGVGLVSLATLFPLGLMRLRAAAMRTRSAFLVESAVADIEARNLLAKESFLPPSTTYYRFPNFADYGNPYNGRQLAFDPWIQDTPLPTMSNNDGVYRGWGGLGSPLDFNSDGTPDKSFIAGPGLPVAYDPLWRDQTGIIPSNAASLADEYRFARGIGAIRADPNSGTRSDPSAHGLQRITNFPISSPPSTLVASIFVSPDDIVFQSSDFLSNPVLNPTGSKSVGSASPLVPDMSAGMVNDWMYTWMFTGRRLDALGGSAYEGDIVIFHGRPLAVDPAAQVATGETVVEAVFGYSTSVIPPGAAVGYGVADRVVLLRWPETAPDPQIRVGSWIADVTYERYLIAETERQADVDDPVAGVTAYPAQRCHWYQVVKTTPAGPAKQFANDALLYRSMTVVVSTPVRAKTPLMATAGNTRGDPFHVNAALISPYVVNVFPKTFTSR